ncbi:hypothetical protein YH66_00535 [[Brevibacterium] flavum]|uniref:Secreted protein n=1 Tax=[Brevibacterium] flavum TaxID=92706 RepID=A0A0F6SQG1_9CORY|nr:MULTISPECIES: hypothetical protein [Corynebacterium]AKF26149.1 hypothetical protein YH66_00535 [[Brevibacterium] flavum]AST19382.1 hypothetical protein CEY17_00540 [Corynebacterium glutamicum ATCC 14067]KEI21825.1 hypothetical protein KIQ_004315 [Corynebacterium glutamicum ATCC 14067]KIH74946.1 hypothetical protein SD36_00650 [Corynebacterium glutamicum]OKX92122.1 hypothetical protein AUP71_13695 [Corynebacterium glutamicum]
MSFLNSAKTKTVAFTATFVGAATLATPAIASADIIDNALAALPSGEISCSQAEKYWTTEADYNSKVAQANALAMFDSRGPQIKAALARVDEAANRCGLKGGTVAAQGEATAPQAEATAPQDNTGTSQTAPAPAAPTAPAAPAATPVVNLAPAGSPTFTIEVPGVGGVQLPDLYQIVQQFLAQFGIKI